jgi:hypothetical protein
MDELYKNFPVVAIAVLLLYGVGVTYKLFTSIYFDAKKDYLTKLLRYCESISEIVSKIAIAKSYPTELIEEFWKYYYGKLILVENKELEKQMVALAKILRRTDKKNFETQRIELKSSALSVSGACRELIKSSWRSWFVPWEKSEVKRNAEKELQ